MKNYTTSIFDPKLRGALVRNFISRYSYINSTIKDKTFNAWPVNAALDDGGSLSDYISRTDHAYLTKLLDNKVFVNVPMISSTKNMLQGTYQTIDTEFDAYYNPIKTTVNMGGAGSKIVETTYDNNLSGYYIGRPLTVKTTLNNGSDVYTSQEEYTYSGFLPTQIRKRGNNTGWITENLTYDDFGNIAKKITATPDGSQRSVAMVYDDSGRFMTALTDENGMTTSAVFDPVTGNKLKTVNPFDQAETYQYDTWGRLIGSTDYLNIKSQIKYVADGSNIILTHTNDEDESKITVINALGQTIESKEKNLLGNYVGKAFKYDVYGRQTASSQPEQEGNYSQWNSVVYDEYDRVKQAISYTGKTTNINYNGLSVTANDGVKTIITTKNAFGQVVSLQDPGGIINYAYYANGNMKTADYGGFVQSIEQDGWGRKTKLTDPSAGVYQYEYDNWGQLTKETTPKGSTEYIYDPAGKITQKKIKGDNTNMQYNYTYDTNAKLLTKIELSNSDGNNTAYSYLYDDYKRISSATEDNPQARFVKAYAYDSYGRISAESYEAKDKLSGLSAKKTIEMQYQNGELLQTKLQETGQILWKITGLNSNGQLSEAAQGEALKNNYQYDAYGLPKEISVQKMTDNQVVLMNLSYKFDAQRGLLNDRANSALGWNETFSYDNHNRLTGFKDNLGNNSQTYDNRGRIKNNSQLGYYKYDNNSYKQLALNLNDQAEANNYYQQNHALQQITYNAFKSPVEIYEKDKERISFEYNASLGRAHMYYGDEQENKMNRRFRRHYSEEGIMEITNDLQTAKTVFVFYLGGDAYNAPAIWKQEHQNNQSTQNLYYLHRDHLGSIVMITNSQGEAVEKRQFDAWGNIVKLEDGKGNPLTAFLITDRGYTGHEHLPGVDLIHMNGRLYDPKLHRFLSADDYVQEPYNSQNYNRYAYALNNPLIYTDPDGHIFWLIPIIWTVAKAAIIGAAIGAAGYTASVAFSDGGFKNWNWSQFGKAAGIGAISGVVTAGIGSVFGAVGSNGIMGEIARAYTHGFANGMISELSGGNFVDGFVYAGLSSLAGSAFMMYGGVVANSQIGAYAFSAVAGGVGAELTGGNFWQGAATGLIIAGLNHLQNSLSEKLAKLAEEYKKNPDLYDKRWDYNSPPDKSQKCNYFMNDLSEEIGIPLDRSYSAGEWADPNVAIPGWSKAFSKNPTRGVSAAYKKISAHATGHVGVITKPANRYLIYNGLHSIKGCSINVYTKWNKETWFYRIPLGRR